MLRNESNGAEELLSEEPAYTIVRMADTKLVGIRLKEPFPGFDYKAEYLTDGWERLAALLEGKLCAENPSAYFVYHGCEAGLCLCVRMNDLKGIPDGLVQIPVPGREFAVVSCQGSFSDQEQIFMDICKADFEMDLDAIRFEQYDRRLLPSETGEYEFKLYFPMKDGRNVSE
ncbi:GyrI-like domain-containing protein [Paenibacillus ginsengarvi]|uniref:GyrI-like domain-containing protein n=1 Tax=Paenibacillus ginsengarvi TaxID=400777 RepID=UPI001961D992|nr:GyrI-like domain-containing protein [Paenibacillus ginsengarvi]